MGLCDRSAAASKHTLSLTTAESFLMGPSATCTWSPGVLNKYLKNEVKINGP